MNTDEILSNMEKRISALEHHCHSMTGHASTYTGDVEPCASPVLASTKRVLSASYSSADKAEADALRIIRAAIKADAEARAAKYGEPCNEDDLSEAESEFRSSGEDAIGVPPWKYSRHYEVSVKAKLIEGQWVGWLYWYGGGKHGDPDSIDWIDDAIFLEEGEPQVIKTFKVKK